MEWQWTKKGDRVLHIELVEWADIILVAPLSAHSASKIYHSLSDNTLSLIFRALPYKPVSSWRILNHVMSWFTGRSKVVDKLVVLCPAMNTKMYEQPITEKQFGHF